MTLSERERERLLRLGLSPGSLVHSLDLAEILPEPLAPSGPLPQHPSARYRLGEEVGRGGFGTVRRARDLRLERDVAVKRVAGTADERSARRFLDEARIAASLDHPGIVRVFDVDRDEDGLFLVLEWVEGEDLARRIARGTLSPEAVAQVGVRIADALAYAHGRGVLHRDVHPGNVVLVGERDAKLVDFGLAAPLARLRGGELAGTPGFIAPEIIAGRPAGPASDVWSAGMTLAAALLGPTPDRAALARISSPVARVLAEATEPEPSRRLPSAAVLAARLALPGAASGDGSGLPRPCPSCGARIAPGHRHCRLCGADAGPGCPACGHDGPEVGLFCPACGAHRTRFSVLRRYLCEQRARVFREGRDSI
ncbi:MAG: protein kinase [Planctomycetes bacterium]|nr:protein kinase [Planctomycetota bacterium]